MKKKISSIVGAALAIVLILSLVVALAPAAPANEVNASPGEGKWEKFVTPKAGSLSGYLLVPSTGSDGGPAFLEKAIDGSLYAYWDIGEAAKGSNLYKSTDNGRSWSRCSSTTDELSTEAIIAIATSTEDADVLYVATSDANKIFKSINAGDTFTAVAAISFNTTTENISCFDVGFSGGTYFLVVGTATPATEAPDGEVYVRQDTYGGIWNSQTIDLASAGNVNVRGIACSPNFATEGSPQIVAVADNGTNVYVIYQYAGGDWISETELLINDATAITDNIVSADIAFPSDYDSRATYRDLWIGISGNATGVGGDVYHVVVSEVTDQQLKGSTDSSVNVTSLAITGSMGATMQLAGTDTYDVYHSEDDSDTWFSSKYDPSGVDKTGYVVMADDYYDSGTAWIATAGAQGALSQTTDSGVSWTQISLINTYINTIGSIAVSPNYAEDTTIFMVTANGTASQSLFRWDGSYWERVCDNQTQAIYLDMAEINLVQVSPDFATSNAVFLADKSTPRISRSTNGGLWFKKQSAKPTWDTAGGWLVVNSSTVIVGQETGKLHRTTNNGASWSSKTATGCNIATTFSISPDYANDTSLLMGDNDDGVFRSTDAGSTWKSIPSGIDVESGAGTSYVAFDSDYANNSTVYAAAQGTDGVYRLVIDEDTTWKRIDTLTSTSWPTTSTAGVVIEGMVAANGAVYVADQGLGAAVEELVAADAFIIIEPAASSDNGTVVCTSGSVTLTPADNATVDAAASPVTITAGGSANWTLTDAGDSITVSAALDDSVGVWAKYTTGASVAGISVDEDSDASVAATGGAFSLPDAAVTESAVAPTPRAVLRAINPTASVVSPYGPFFEAMNKEWTAGANTALRYSTSADGYNVLWTIKDSNAIWSYEDVATVAPVLVSPEEGYSTGRSAVADLSWEKVPSATKYHLWYALDSAFKIGVVKDDPTGPSTAAQRISGLEPGKTYYWKVAVFTGKPTLSPWSEVRSFTTGIAAAEWSPFTNADGVAPVPGASAVPLKPVFQWNAADWATGYDFVLADNPDFTSPITEKTVTSTVFTSDKELSLSTNYYWKVRAISGTSQSPWGMGAFTTIAKPVEVGPAVPQKIEVTIPPIEIPPTAAPILPAVYVWTIVGIGAALVIAVIILIVRTRRIP